MQSKQDLENKTWIQINPLEIEKGKVMYTYSEGYLPYKIHLCFKSKVSGFSLDYWEYEDGRFYLAFNGMSKEAADEVKAHLDEFSQFSNSNVEAYPNTLPPNPLYLLECRSDNKQLLGKFLTIIDQYLPLDNLNKDLLPRMQLDDYREEIQESLKKDISKAMKIALAAQEKGEFEHIWHLANHLLEATEKKISDTELFEFIDKISQNNPYYSQAQGILAEVIFTQPPSKSSEKNIARLENAFYYALNSGSQNQVLTDQIYHLLCGRKGLTCVIRDVKGDYATLIATAREIRSLILEKKRLKQEIKVKNKDYLSSRNYDEDEKTKPEKTSLSGEKTARAENSRSNFFNKDKTDSKQPKSNHQRRHSLGN